MVGEPRSRSGIGVPPVCFVQGSYLPTQDQPTNRHTQYPLFLKRSAGPLWPFHQAWVQAPWPSFPSGPLFLKRSTGPLWPFHQAWVQAPDRASRPAVTSIQASSTSPVQAPGRPPRPGQLDQPSASTRPTSPTSPPCQSHRSRPARPAQCKHQTDLPDLPTRLARD